MLDVDRADLRSTRELVCKLVPDECSEVRVGDSTWPLHAGWKRFIVGVLLKRNKCRGKAAIADYSVMHRPPPYLRERALEEDVSEK